MDIENVLTVTQPWSIVIFLMTHWLLMTLSFNQYLPNDLIPLSTLIDLPNPQMNQSISSSSASYQIFYSISLTSKWANQYLPSHCPARLYITDSTLFQTLHCFTWCFHFEPSSLVNLPHGWYLDTRSFFATLQFLFVIPRQVLQNSLSILLIKSHPLRWQS